MKTAILLLILCMCTFAQSQEIITGTYDFQTDPEKKFALYIPSAYSPDTPTKVIVGLHPWNTSKWDAESWAEELMELAEANDCIVICPDGGPDGQIDDDIDTAFTSFLIDEMALQYNLDENNVYLVGFSWGGLTTYTYGLSHANKFAGFMPIGAAVSVADVSSLAEAADGKPFYIIHGSQDSPGVRFHPLVSMMESAGACVETNLLAGIGHTIEFPDQFNILNTGFQYLLDNTCNIPSSSPIQKDNNISLKSNFISSGDRLIIDTEEAIQWRIFASSGQVRKSGNHSSIEINLPTGMYFIEINQQVHRFVVQ